MLINLLKVLSIMKSNRNLKQDIDLSQNKNNKNKKMRGRNYPCRRCDEMFKYRSKVSEHFQTDILHDLSNTHT